MPPLAKVNELLFVVAPFVACVTAVMFSLKTILKLSPNQFSESKPDDLAKDSIVELPVFESITGVDLP